METFKAKWLIYSTTYLISSVRQTRSTIYIYR